jgi:hypothetical protein
MGDALETLWEALSWLRDIENHFLKDAPEIPAELGGTVN